MGSMASEATGLWICPSLSSWSFEAVEGNLCTDYLASGFLLSWWVWKAYMQPPQSVLLFKDQEQWRGTGMLLFQLENICENAHRESQCLPCSPFSPTWKENHQAENHFPETLGCGQEGGCWENGAEADLPMLTECAEGLTTDPSLQPTSIQGVQNGDSCVNHRAGYL